MSSPTKKTEKYPYDVHCRNVLFDPPKISTVIRYGPPKHLLWVDSCLAIPTYNQVGFLQALYLIHNLVGAQPVFHPSKTMTPDKSFQRSSCKTSLDRTCRVIRFETQAARGHGNCNHSETQQWAPKKSHTFKKIKSNIHWKCRFQMYDCEPIGPAKAFKITNVFFSITFSSTLNLKYNK